MNHDHSSGMGKHMLLMVLCCLVPIALIVAVGVLGLSLGPLSGLLPYALVLLCPLMMFFMMRGMSQEHGADVAQHHRSDLGYVDTPRITGNAKGTVETTVPEREQLH
ncbi:MAG: DUF2933 domain-containing protein [Chloroflexi bacterium]|nr:DUF2933 domain-containing protein [Chloroflexota bacterium]